MEHRNSRSKNAIQNIMIGYIVQIGILILSFVGRKVFLNYLSVDYLGINGLYSNILSVLSLAELGIGNVSVFSLYKPVADNDQSKICALTRFYGKVYYLIAAGVFVIGVALIPFLHLIIKSELNSTSIILYYVLFLIGTVSSYFAAHKIALLNANQNMRIQRLIALSMSLVQHIFQILVLIIWKNYIAYMCVQVAGSVMTNVVTNIYANRQYPYLKMKVSLSSLEQKNIFRNISSSALYKLGTVAINNTDNILISVLVSTAAVGLYSNYCMLVLAIQGFISIVTNALIIGIGNLNTEGNKQRMHEMFNVMLFLYHFISAFVAISFYFILNDFIPIWLGSEYILDQSIVFSISLNIYLTNAISPVWMYREATGMFNDVKYLMICTAIANIILSVLLGTLWGVSGILFASTLSRIITSFWYEPRLLFNRAFECGVAQYWLNQGKYFLCSVVATLLSCLLDSILGSSLIFIVIKGMCFFCITIVVFGVINIRSNEVNWMLHFVKNKIYKRES